MTHEELLAHFNRIWAALPENKLDAMTALGLVCNTLVNQVEKEYPGRDLARSWMTTLRDVFDNDGVET